MSSIEFKTFRLRELKAIGDDGTFEGYASVFGNVDTYDDVVEPGAFSKTIAEQDGHVPILWQHSPWEPIGLSLELREDKTGLFTRGQLNLDTQRGREAYSLLKQGATAGAGRGPLKGLSIGYQTIKYAIEGQVRRLKELKLWEYSLVTFPANELAVVNAVKDALGDGDGLRMLEQLAALAAPLAKGVVAFGDLPLGDREKAWDAGEALQRVEAWAKDADGDLDAAKFARAFCWFDSSAADTDHDDGYPDAVSAYKLLIADVVDGTLTAMPRGIFAAANVLSGGRGGVDIPTADQARIRANLSRYYAKMRHEFDDESIVAPWEDGKWSSPVLDLKEGRVLSGTTRAALSTAAGHALAAHMTLQALLDATEPGEGPTPEPGAAPLDEDTVKATVAAFAKSIGAGRDDVSETFAAFAQSIKTT